MIQRDRLDSFDIRWMYVSVRIRASVLKSKSMSKSELCSIYLSEYTAVK